VVQKKEAVLKVKAAFFLAIPPPPKFLFRCLVKNECSFFLIHGQSGFDIFQPHAQMGGLWVKSNAIILHRQLNNPLINQELYVYGGGLRVLYGIVE